MIIIRGGFRAGRGMHASPIPRPYFLRWLVSCNHFEELKPVLFEVELIINNIPLTYIYPNNIETCWTRNHFLFGRQLMYSTNTTSTVVRNLTLLSSTTDKINCIISHFLDRWRHEYLVNSRETQRTLKLNINSKKVYVNDFMLVFYEKVPRHFWRIAIVTWVLPRRDSEIWGANLRIAKTNTIPKRSVITLRVWNF